MLKVLSKWITPALYQTWLLVVGVFGVLVIVVKLLLTYLRLVKKDNKTLEAELKRVERIRNVKISNSRDESTKRLRMRGDLRDGQD